uniref:M16 family metallopeptidase n=1 Tax=Anaeromyxobacter oryzisoli TaxID=2925408 RepID=UPI001F5883E0
MIRPGHLFPRLLPLVVALACATPTRPPPPAQPQKVAAPAQPQATAIPDRSRVPPLGPPPALELPAQRHFVLANGLKVRLVERHRLPIVALHLVVDAGGIHDPPNLPGLASFTAAMLTEGGTRTRTPTRISDQVGFLGASLGGGATQDSAFLSGAVLSRHLPELLDIFADVAMNPAFPRKDFLRVQDQREVTLVQQRDQPPIVATKAFTDVFWGGGNPYGHYVLGTEASVAATTPGDLARLHARLWRPENAELVVVGDVTEAALRPLLDRTIGAWKRGTAAPPLRPQPVAAPHRALLVEKAEAPQSSLLLGMPGVERASKDYVAASVLFQVLGGGTSSRLFRNLREEKGYTYGLGAGADARRLAGVSVVRGNVKADVTGPALKEIFGELERLRREPVPDAELQDAKQALVRSLPADFATVGGVAGRVAELIAYGLPDDYWNRYADAVQQVTAEDVRRVAERVLDPSRATLVIVGTPAVVSPQLAGLPIGSVEILPPPGPPPAGRRAPAKAPARPRAAPPAAMPPPAALA